MNKNNYELIDSGDGEKLERFGVLVVRRPDPEALWKKENEESWQNADMTFVRVGSRGGNWKKKKEIPESWEITYGGFKFKITPTSFKHLGLFPEQIENWEFIKNIKGLKGKRALNLFGYTGGATLACARSGMEVTHVDASKPVVDWAKENAKLNGFLSNETSREKFLPAELASLKQSSAQNFSRESSSIRWLVDDALYFVKKEVRRGAKYDAIIMDPPAFGHGPNGEVWKIEENFITLFEKCLELLSDEPVFFIVSGYASGYSKIVFENNLKIIKEKFGGKIESTELTLKEESSREFLLPAGVTARWKNSEK